MSLFWWVIGVLLALIIIGWYITAECIPKKWNFHLGPEFFISLIATIIIGTTLTLMGSHYSQKASDEALYPNNFGADLEFYSRTSLVQPGQKKGKFEVFIAESKDIEFRIAIKNNSKYPAKHFPISLYLRDEDFQENIEDIKKHIRSLPLLAFTLLDVDSLDLTIEGVKTKMKGCGFLYPYIPKKTPNFIPPIKLSLKNQVGYFAVMVRDKIFRFEIQLKNVDKKIKEVVPHLDINCESGVTATPDQGQSDLMNKRISTGDLEFQCLGNEDFKGWKTDKK